MNPQAETPMPPAYGFARENPEYRQGLTAQQVEQRYRAGAHNAQPESLTPSVGQIVRKNTLTLFNFINLALAVVILLVGRPENILFLGVAIINTIMGIVQEMRSKRTLDKLAILAQTKAAVVRDGQLLSIDQNHVVLDDILYLTAGNQICTDALVVRASGLEVDESLLTGEPDNVRKHSGDVVLSGSFVTAGHAYVQVSAVGANNYATALTVEAKKEKGQNSQLMRTMHGIIKVLTFVIIPLGLALFFTQLDNEGATLQTAVLGASAAMIGMIPEGLVLLTSVTLTVGAMNLARRKALVQSLYSIETLARVDVLCLDKTGTITDGTLGFEQLLPLENINEQQAGRTIAELVAAVGDDNATAQVLRATFGGEAHWKATAVVPFSSARKWSGAVFGNDGSYVIGAPAFVFPGQKMPFDDTVKQYAGQGHRVLCLAHSYTQMQGEALPESLHCLALVVLSDTIRSEAPDTFRYFENEGVILKVISGDDPLTVSTIAVRAGITGAERYVDMSRQGDDCDYRAIVEEHTVFGRVSPHQKRELIRALRANGHTACMTGDGVNDVLAMKEADCSVAMINGSDAARGACDFVLMTSDFSAMIEVLREGRRVINNIEMVSSLYLVKTIYSALLSIIHIFIPLPYPFAPLQMTPINALTVGIPSFFLALRSNYQRPEGRFVANILENALPAALTVVINAMVVQLAGIFFDLSSQETSTLVVFLTGATMFLLLYRVAHPLTLRMKLMLGALALAFGIVFIFFGEQFLLVSLFSRNAFFYLPLLVASPRLFDGITYLVKRGETLLERMRTRQRSSGTGA